MAVLGIKRRFNCKKSIPHTRICSSGFFCAARGVKDSVNTDLILLSISVWSSYTTDESYTAYVVNFVKCFFDPGSGLADPVNPVYTSTYLNNLASFTLDKDGNLVAFDEPADGADDSAVYEICSPLTDAAEGVLAQAATC